MFWAELNGVPLVRYTWDAIVRNHTAGGLVMDSRGIFDASKNESPLHGLRSSRSGYEYAAAVDQARKAETIFKWVHGGAQLVDCMTKSGYPARVTWDLFIAN